MQKPDETKIEEVTKENPPKVGWFVRMRNGEWSIGPLMSDGLVAYAKIRVGAMEYDRTWGGITGRFSGISNHEFDITHQAPAIIECETVTKIKLNQREAAAKALESPLPKGWLKEELESVHSEEHDHRYHAIHFAKLCEGEEAFGVGKVRADNPYGRLDGPVTVEFEAWDTGWLSMWAEKHYEDASEVQKLRERVAELEAQNGLLRSLLEEQDTKPLFEGRAAYNDGIARSDNPYIKPSPKYGIWDDGWLAAWAERNYDRLRQREAENERLRKLFTEPVGDFLSIVDGLKKAVADGAKCDQWAQAHLHRIREAGCNQMQPAGDSPNPLATQVGGDHYMRCKIQPLEYITANGLGFVEGNVVKYITRWKVLGNRQDVEKARDYCEKILAMEDT